MRTQEKPYGSLFDAGYNQKYLKAATLISHRLAGIYNTLCPFLLQNLNTNGVV